MRDAIMTLLERRGTGKTVCPSEAARLFGTDAADWRDNMPEVHEVVRILHREGAIQLSWRGKYRAPGDGPYRIGKNP